MCRNSVEKNRLSYSGTLLYCLKLYEIFNEVYFCGDETRDVDHTVDGERNALTLTLLFTNTALPD